ncbi:hypothetical protein JRO89_XS01G0118100 [Xanthoceras sorbifolium]|uniref:Glucose-6-phosphate dehydrogenase (NADP(+)) n=1 Tax=Xanthoceras sorbifolium TaxID=99658 RepID=A0ABQ8IJ01_9ROSI|nr:hypothetical protein JRO89_XS01G0118100 [Xanthoceras sorbifolium]
MAIICLSPCSSSSLKRFLLSPSSSFNDHHETLPRSLCFLKCDSENHCGLCRINQRKHFELKASNLQPSNPVVVAGDFSSVPLDFSAAEHVKVASEGRCFHFFDTEKSESILSIIVLGASGDLARTKIFPTLFGLFYKVRLPENFTIFGYARSVMTSKELGNMISRTLTCRIGNSSEEHYLELDSKLKEKEARRLSNRLFYLAIPPNVSLDVVRCARRRASSENGWTRFIVEKPFGYDLESSRELTRDIKQYLSEDQIFRNYIRNVQLIFSQDSRTDRQSSRCPREIPDAYERKLLDAIEGERRSFVRSDELDAAWEVFTPLLKELERKKVVPELYSCGSTGPVGVHYLASKHNVHYKDYL